MNSSSSDAHTRAIAQVQSSPAPALKPGLERKLGSFDATMLIVGDIIGVGIFTTTGLVAEAFPHPGWILLAWVVGGLLTLCGALTIAELGSALPRAGGEYVYLREAYGPLAGFLNGWTYLTVTSSGSIAAMAVALAAFLADGAVPVVQLPLGIGTLAISARQLIAVAVLLFFTAASYVGVRFGSLLQDILAVAKIVAVVGVAVAGMALGHGSWSHFTAGADAGSTGGFGTAVGAAAIGVLFSYSGWFACTYIAGEIKNPTRNIPRSLLAGTLIATTIYFVVNIAYLYALPLSELRGAVNVGELAAARLFGGGISTVFTAIMVVTIMGSLNSVIMSSPRIYYAMARDGLFFDSIGCVHPRFKTPTRSLLLQAVLATLLICSGSFGQLLTYVTVAMVLFSIMSATAVFVLRRRRPELPRPYRMPGYPWVPLAFIAVYACIFVSFLVARPRESLLGLAMVASGVPVYWGWSWWQRRGPGGSPDSVLAAQPVPVRTNDSFCNRKNHHEDYID